MTDKKAAQDDADVQAAVKKVTEELGDTGRILVRESGTEPVVRVMVEAESEEICQKYVDMVVNVIKEKWVCGRIRGWMPWMLPPGVCQAAVVYR